MPHDSRSSSGRAALWALAWAALSAASCGVDERGMSFTIGQSSSGSGSAGDGAGPSGGSAPVAGTSGAVSGGNDSSAGQGAGGDSDGGEPGRGGSASGGGGAGGSSGGVPPTGGLGGAGTSGGGNAGNGGSGGVGGVSGTGGSGGEGGEPWVSECGDLNRNRVDDCEETLVQNSRFDVDARAWEVEPSTARTWIAQDASGKPASGALAVKNELVNPNYAINITTGSFQCVNVWGKTTVDVAARAFIESGQGSGRAGIELIGYTQADCAGEVAGGATVATGWQEDTWQVLRGKTKVPTAARSVRVRLIAQKPFPQASFEVLFDDILVKKE